MANEATELVFIIDRSGSMTGKEDDTINGFNATLRQQQTVEGKAYVTTVLFDDQYELLHNRVDIQKVSSMTNKDYTPRGMTALLDAIGKTIHNTREAQRNAKEEDRAEKAIFFIITDGHENASQHYTVEMIQERIRHQREKHGWEFIFFGAGMDAIAEAAKLGIGADRACKYRADSEGTSSVYTSISAMSTDFRLGKSIPSMEQTDAIPEITEPMTVAEAQYMYAEMLNDLAASLDELQGVLIEAQELNKRQSRIKMKRRRWWKK